MLVGRIYAQLGQARSERKAIELQAPRLAPAFALRGKAEVQSGRPDCMVINTRHRETGPVSTQAVLSYSDSLKAFKT